MVLWLFLFQFNFLMSNYRRITCGSLLCKWSEVFFFLVYLMNWGLFIQLFKHNCHAPSDKLLALRIDYLFNSFQHPHLALNTILSAHSSKTDAKLTNHVPFSRKRTSEAVKIRKFIWKSVIDLSEEKFTSRARQAMCQISDVTIETIEAERHGTAQ